MKDKAKELVERFNNIRSEEPCFIISLNQAKQCALIAVDFAKEKMNNLTADNDTVLTDMTKLHFLELQELKTEIENL